MYAYPQSVKTEFYNGTDWVDISSYLVSDIRGNSGFTTSLPDDRVSQLGLLEFTLNNADGLFTPYGGSFPALTGFNRGAKVKVTVTYDKRSRVFWIGRIDTIKSDSGTWGDRRVDVLCSDWNEIVSNYPMKGTQIELDKRIDESVTSILNRLPIQPEAVNSDVGDEVFPAVFSNVKDKTRALDELNKLALSELGYIYLLADGTLRVENSSARSGTRELDKVPVISSNSGRLLLNGTDKLLVDDNSNLILDEYEDAGLKVEDLEINLKNDIINSVFSRAYPTKTDTDLVVVFSLGSPITVGTGATVTFTTRYTNPNGGNSINATNLQAPVATTDYLFNSLEDGTGTDLTANLSVTAVYWGDVVDYTLRNTGTTPGYVTKLQARGYGIYYDNPIDSIYQDADSANAFGDYVIDINQKYKSNFFSGYAYGKSIVELYKNPKSRIKSVKFNANVDERQMMTSLYLDIGKLIQVYDNVSQMNKWYYIYSRKFSISTGGVINIYYGLIEAPSLNSGGLKPVGIEFAGDGSHDAIDFGFLPNIYSNTTPETLTMSAWVYIDSFPSDPKSALIMGATTDNGGIRMFLPFSATRRVRVYHNIFNTAPGFWANSSTTITTGQWYHFAFTMDISSTSNDPIIYVDGVNEGATELFTPAGSKFSKDGTPIVLGSMKTSTLDYDWTLDGKIFDARIYHRILSSDEIADIYNGGVKDMLAGPKDMVFQAVTINSDLGDSTSLDGMEIPEGNNYFENILRYVGKPNGNPIIREI